MKDFFSNLTPQPARFILLSMPCVQVPHLGLRGPGPDSEGGGGRRDGHHGGRGGPPGQADGGRRQHGARH